MREIDPGYRISHSFDIYGFSPHFHYVIRAHIYNKAWIYNNN